MQRKAITGRIIRGRFVLLSLLLIVFFFLPWLRLTSDRQTWLRRTRGRTEDGKASGLQLARGTMTAVSYDDTMLGIGWSESERYNDEIKSRPAFYLGLAIPSLLLVIGMLGLKGWLKAGSLGLCMLILAAHGVFLMLLATDVEYAHDFIEKLRQEEPAVTPWVTGSLPPIQRHVKEKWITDAECETRPTFIFWASLVLYALVAFFGLLNLIISVVPAGHWLRRRRR